MRSTIYASTSVHTAGANTGTLCLNRATLITPQGFRVFLWSGWKESGYTHKITQMRIMSHTNITFIQDVFVRVDLGEGFFKLRAVLGFKVYHLITRPHILITQRSTEDNTHNIFSSVFTFLKYSKHCILKLSTPLNSS